ncbi:hypothetical protein SEUCBS140593_007228 [Sporothrix eucalyptigena]|uniref:Aminoglycoside phosphotransferase domain-containing protein n=1 Tax=Sporothrix eucalyptigena TaxID=1812306 RepID=A0ABP0CD69_9PEZI
MADRTQILAKIKQRFADEQSNPPVPRKYGDIPVSYEAVTAEWLTATLARDATPGTVVKAFRLGPRDSGSFNRRRIFLEWDGPDAAKMPTSVFCKAAQDLLNRIMLSNGGTLSEIAFYAHVRSRLPELATADALFAGYDPESWASLIMMKDLPTATFCSYKTVLTKQQFQEQFEVLAQLHGRFYNSTEPFFGSLMTFQQRFTNLVNNLDYESSCCNGFRAAQPQISERLFSREADVWPATVRSVERNGSLPPTLIHGDVHLGNWFITPDGHMGITDWQVLSRGHWSRDLAYVLGTGVSVERRREWEKDMVAVYVKALGAAGGPTVSTDEAWLELRRQSLAALAYWTCTLTPSASMPDMQPEAPTREFIKRLAALVDDHDALDSFEGL